MSLKRQYRPIPSGVKFQGEPTWNVQYSFFGLRWTTIKQPGPGYQPAIHLASRESAIKWIEYKIQENERERQKRYVG